MTTSLKIAVAVTALSLGLGNHARAEDYGVWNVPSFGATERARRPNVPAVEPQPSQARAPVWTPVSPATPLVADGGARPDIAPQAPSLVMVSEAYPARTILIDTGARRLYRINGDGTAYSYPIGVGREGFGWSGTETVSRVAAWPDWHPPADMRARQPSLPVKMTGGVRNPLGARAIYLGSTLYRIHGTDAPKTVGTAQSSGCFRMLNEHAVHLAGLVQAGDTVVVAPEIDPGFIMAAIPEPKAARAFR